MRVVDYIIDSLGELGIKDVFEFYGGACADLIDAFTKTDKTRYVTVLHEQAGGYAAEGYARINGLGAMIATSGPGGQNLLTPISNCFYESIPTIFITGQAAQRFLRPNDSVRQVGFQETPIAEIAKPITKYAVMIKDPEQVRHEFEKAVYIAKSGRPGPVLLDIPMDVQESKIEPEKLRGFDSSAHEIKYDWGKIDGQIDQFLKDISHSERPYVLIGGGVRLAGALEELAEIENILKIPFSPTWNAIDAVTSDGKYYGGRIGVCGGKGRNFGIQNSDLLLMVGSRLSRRIPGGGIEYFAREAKKYMVDIDRASLATQIVPIDEKVLCDSKIFLQRLIKRARQEKIPDFSGWNKRVFEWRDKYDPVLPEHYASDSNGGKVHPYSFMRILSQEAGPNDIFISDAGGNVTTFNQAFETKRGQRAFSNYSNSPMGFSFPAAIGAWFASDKTQNVVSIIGDGAFNLNIQELQTIKTYNVKTKTFIVNNHCLGFTRQFQKRRHGRTEACGPEGYKCPDFMKIVQAYGIKAVKIDKNDTETIRKQIREVLSAEEPVVCDVDQGDFDDYAPRIQGDAPLEDMFPYLPREEFKGNMIVEPVKGWDNLYK